MAQCRAVFLAGNGFPQRWQGQDSIQILETGFGLGLNFLTTWLDWRSTAATHGRLHFVSLEQAPLTAQDLALALTPYADLADLTSALVRAWPPLTRGLHTLTFEQGRVTLLLGLGDFAELLPQLTLALDAVYLDGFSPSKNPEAWSDFVLRQIARHCRHGATLASWCVAGEVRRRLEKHGFRTHRARGFGGKRQRLEACFDKIPVTAWRRIVQQAPQPLLQATFKLSPQRHALVIGAGLAGCLVSAELAARGWRVDLFDAHAGPAQGASGNPAGILRPYPSLDDNRAARLTRAGYLRAWQQLPTLVATSDWDRCGVLHMARDAEQGQHWQAMVHHLAQPSPLMRWCSPQEAEQRGLCPAPWGGLWFSEAGWVDPGAWCRGALAHHSLAVHPHWQSQVTVHPVQDGWQVCNQRQEVLAQAPWAILAGGANPLPIALETLWPHHYWPGQITQLAQHPWPVHHPILCRAGYVIPDAPGGPCVGATYRQSSEQTIKADECQENLQRWRSFTQEPPLVVHERVGLRHVSQDRLPIIGPLRQHPGLFTLTALGSRGLAWAPLGAQLIAAWLAGEPLPLERELIEAIAPARYGVG